MSRPSRDTLIALTGLGFSLLALLVWIPFDVESGVLEKHRRTVYIGDAMLPTLCAGLILLTSLLMLVTQWLKPKRRNLTDNDAGLRSRALLRFQFSVWFFITCALGVMFYLGSFSVWLAGQAGIESSSYRELRDTIPWKYIGFIAGGSILVSSLIGLIENRFRFRHAVIGVLTSLLLILIFDLPFEDLLLPPNGDY